MNLRRGEKRSFSCFTNAEVQKMEQLLEGAKAKSLNTDTDFYKSVAKRFNRSSSQAGKPTLKWIQIWKWFQTKQESHISEEISCNEAQDISEKSGKTSFDEAKEIHTQSEVTGSPNIPEGHMLEETSYSEDNDISGETSFDQAKELHVPDSLNQDEATEIPNLPEGPMSKDLLNMKFEAKASDGAWYDVEWFISCKDSEPNLEDTVVRVRFKEFGPEHDEWLNVKNHIRQQSVALEHWECHKLEVGDPVVCLRDRVDESKYYDARVLSIKKRQHDVRGCRCLFLVDYDHDSSQEMVRLKQIYCRPELVARRANR